jgi:anti-sigma regulatory factor (Ser/Thr protein kinase)
MEMTASRPQMSLPVDDQSQVGEARRMVASLGLELGLGATVQAEAALVATELARNLVKHATRGELLVRPIDGSGVEILALDKGPGMADVARCLEDGYSTAGTPGNGLGAVRRVAKRFDVYSRPGAGTAVVAEVRGARDAVAPGAAGVVCLAVKGETKSGDSWFVGPRRDGGFLAVVADGLGHGASANVAAETAIAIARQHVDQSPAELLQRMHPALRATRGAAVAVAVSSPGQPLRYAGVGNISGVCVNATTTRSLVSHNGTLGHEMRRVQEFTAEFPAGTSLVMHSDGLASHWRIDKYPGLLLHDPALVAGLLYRDHTRGRDDVTVLVLRSSS